MDPMTGQVWANGEIEDRKLIKVNEVLCRESTADADIVKEIGRSYGWLDVKGKVVLDIGANIGAFTCWALEQGALQVIAIEPDPLNYNMLWKNTCQLSNKLIVQVAVVEDNFEDSFTELWRTDSGKNPGNYSLEVKGGRTAIKVGTVGFKSILDNYHPHVIKVDCEGSEYRWLDGRRLPGVNQVAVELHFGKKKWREDSAPKLVESFREWEVMKEPKLGGKLWHSVAGWRR
jgi:FkbM family methyltransferase